MNRLQGRDEVARRKQRLEDTFGKVSGAALSPELISHYSRYLCVLTSGHAEQSVKELAMQYCRVKSEARIQRYAGAQMKRLRNIDSDKLRQLIQTFDPQWWVKLEAERSDEIAAFDSVATVRNSVSHGGDSGITLSMVQQYFGQISIVLDDLCDLFDPR